MPNLCKMTLIGHIGKDAEFRYLASGTAVTSWSVAVNTGYGDKKETLWFDCSLFGDRGANLAQYLTKGAAVYVEGEFGNRKWTDNQGKEHVVPQVTVREVELLGGKS